WGLVRPERPDPYFRVAQRNVVVAAWNLGATSAAFGDVDGDGRPDVVIVTRSGEGSLVKVFLNKGGRFADKPDHDVPLPGLARPSNVADAHQARVLDDGTRKQAVIAGRFGGLHALDTAAARPQVSRFKPEVAGPCVDVRMVDVDGDGRPDLVTSYGAVYLRG